MTHSEFYDKYHMLGEDQKEVFMACMDHVLGYTGTQYLVVDAPAGMGKSYTINVLRDFLDMNGIGSMALAYTGRASMRVGGNTCHSLLYEPVVDENGDLVRWVRVDPVKVRDLVGSCILVDESSMIPKDMHQELTDIGVPIVYIGDTAQLPPINADKSTFNVMDSLENYKYITLKKMRRFTEESGIAKIAAKLREDNTLMKLKKEDVRTIPKKKAFDPEFYKENQIDMVACGMNKTRKKVNRIIRQSKGLETYPIPQIGEQVVCLQNNVINGTKINNGEIYEVIFFSPVGNDMHMYVLQEVETGKNVSTYILNTTWETEKTPREFQGKKVSCFGFGYCLTVHKNQGSTFNRFLFIDEDVSFFLDQQRFRYTAVTRAAEMLYIAV